MPQMTTKERCTKERCRFHVKWLVARELAHLSKLSHVAIVLLANLQCLWLT